MINFKNFYLSKYTFILTPKEELELPPYKGSTLRGGFGRIFHDLSCKDKRRNECRGCILRDKCPYSYIFDTSPQFDAPYLKKIEDIPRPFIIEPPFEEKTKIFPGETLNFNLILVGKAIDYLPYFVVAFKELGKVGIGKNRKKFLLEKIKANGFKNEEEIAIYSSEDEVIKAVECKFTWAEIIEKSRRQRGVLDSRYLTLKFITPTRIKYQDKFVSVPEFHVIIRNLLRRISNLSYFHCGEKLNINFKYLIDQSTKIKTEKIDVNWVEWERYSFIQERRMKLGGFIGEVIYKGDLSRFLPFLLLGEYIHVGKGATFGLGLYKLITRNQIKKNSSFGIKR